MSFEELFKPREIEDGLAVCMPEDSVFTADALVNALSRLSQMQDLVHSALFACERGLFAELYNEPWGPRVPHPIFSVTKSITSMLLGAAIEKGYIGNEDAAVVDFFPEMRGFIDDERKLGITIKHLATHTSGLDWHELGIPYDDLANSHFAMEQTDDWPAFVLSRPMAHPPGEVFEYNTGAFHLLSIVFERATGSPLDDFAEAVLLKPLGISEFSWSRDPSGRPCAAGSGGGLTITPRSLLKIGLMILAGGEYRENRIVSGDWLERSMAKVVDTPKGLGYGLGWWSSTVAGFKCITARGYAGQALSIVPEIGIAAVFSGFDLEAAKFYDYTLFELLRTLK